MTRPNRNAATVLLSPLHLAIAAIGLVTGGPAGTALGQFGEPYSPPEVPVPVVQVWVFEQPLMPVVVLVLVGLAAAFTLRRSGKPRPAALAIAAAGVVCVGLVLSSGLVTTQREHVAQASREIIRVVAENDRDAATEKMRPTVSLRMGFGAASDTREALLRQIDRLHSVATVRGARVLDTRVQVRSPTLAVAYVRVRVEGDVNGFPIPPYSWWELNFATSDDPASPGGAWDLAAIKPLFIVGVDNPQGR